MTAKIHHENHPVPDSLKEHIDAFVRKAQTYPNFFLPNNDFLGMNPWKMIFKRVPYTMLQGMKFYLPIHLLPTLIFHRKRIMRKYVRSDLLT